MQLGIFLFFALAAINCAFAFELEFFVSASHLYDSPQKVYYVVKLGGYKLGQSHQLKGPAPSWPNRWTASYKSGDKKDIKIEVYDQQTLFSDFLGDMSAPVQDLVSENGQAASTSFNYYKKSLEGGIHVAGKQFPTIYPGDVTLRHRITSVRSTRASASHNHIALPYTLIVALSLDYLLPH